MKMQFCPYCGTKLDVGAHFCKNCGTCVVQEHETTDSNSHYADSKEEVAQPTLDIVKEDSQVQRKIVYDGELHKCPNCGELLKSFVAVCPVCGYELRSVQTNSPVDALAKKLETVPSLDDKIELITNFYIPNTKEDIYDFFILAVSNLEDKYYDTDNAWQAKLEQAYHKARLSFGNTAEFEYLEKLYSRTRKEVTKRERGIASIFRRHKIACIMALLIVGGILTIAVGIILMASNSFEENWGASYSGIMLFLLGICILCMSASVPDDIKNADNFRKNNSSIISVGRDAMDFRKKNYADMVEFLKARGFKNIEVNPERKGFLDTEGAIKSISVSGNTDFSEYDKFDVNSKVIIRYCSIKH